MWEAPFHELWFEQYKMKYKIFITTVPTTILSLPWMIIYPWNVSENKYFSSLTLFVIRKFVAPLKNWYIKLVPKVQLLMLYVFLIFLNMFLRRMWNTFEHWDINTLKYFKKSLMGHSGRKKRRMRENEHLSPSSWSFRQDQITLARMG